MDFEILHATVSQNKMKMTLRFPEWDLSLHGVQLHQPYSQNGEKVWELMLMDTSTSIGTEMRMELTGEILQRLRPFIPPEKV